jgi:PKD repeat protein
MVIINRKMLLNLLSLLEAKKFYFLFVFLPLLSFAQFNPSSVSGLKFWINGDNIHTSNFPLIDSCHDLSGNSNHAFQTNSAFQPEVLPAALNGHNLMRFDGLNDYFEFPTRNDINTVFWVLKEDSNASFNYRGLFGSINDYDFFRNENNKSIWGQYTNINIRLGTTRINSSIVNGTTTLMPTNMSVISLVTTGNVIAQYFSRDRGNIDRSWDGDVAEIIVYNTALSGSDVLSVENYLFNKYAPPIQLGNDTTLCHFPFTLRAKKDYLTSYLWNNSSTNDSLVISIPGQYYLTTTDIFGRVSSDTINVYQEVTPYTVNLGNDTSFCAGTQFTLHAGPSNLSYVWNDGSSDNSITLNQTGMVKVSVIDCPGNISIDSIFVTFNPLPNVNLGNDTTVCFNSGFTLNSGFGAGSLFTWSDNSTDSILELNNSGTFWLSVTDFNGCSGSDTISVQIDSALYYYSLGNDTNFCAGNYLVISGNGATGPVQYLWSDFSTNDSLQIQSAGNYSVIVSDGIGCQKFDTVSVTISGIAPIALFSSNEACYGNTTTFTDQSTPPNGNFLATWEWDFGDGSNIVFLQNPSHIYPDSGTFNAKLTITTDSGCKAVFSGSVHVVPLPSSNFSIQGFLCDNSSVSFYDASNSFGYPITSWNWSFGDPSSGPLNFSNLQNPNHSFLSNANFQVSLNVQNNKGCVDSSLQLITIKPSPSANFNFTNVCSNLPVAFNDNSILQPGINVVSAQWDFGGQGSSTALNPSFQFSQGGSYPVTYIVEASNNCYDTITLSVPVKPSPVTGFQLSSTCIKDTINFIDSSQILSGNIVTWNWKINGQQFSNNPNASTIFNQPDTIIVQLIVTSNLGCTDTLRDTIQIHSLPVANFNFSPAFGTPPLDVTFTNTTIGGSTYNWDFGNGFISNSVSPIHQFVDTGLFLVTLNATSPFGCKSKDTASILVFLPRLDAAAIGSNLEEVDGFLKVKGLFKNSGTTPLTKMELFARLNDGSFVREIWTGFLPKGALLNYTFNSNLYLIDKENYVCVTVQNPNDSTDALPSNNEYCSAFDAQGLIVYELYPNPATDQIRVPVYVPERGEITLSLYDANGKLVWDPSKSLKEKGLQYFDLNTYSLGYGIYCLVVENKNKKIPVKFMRDR